MHTVKKTKSKEAPSTRTATKPASRTANLYADHTASFVTAGPIISASYHNVMRRINTLMDKGSEQLTLEEIDELRNLATLAERYEEIKYPSETTSVLGGLLVQKMNDMHLSQSEMAKLLGISRPHLTLIINGSQKPDVKLLKAIHDNLGVDAHLLFEMI